MDDKSDEAYQRAVVFAARVAEGWNPESWDKALAKAEAEKKITHAEGGWWYEAPVRFRCLLGRHHTQTSGLFHGRRVERCSCGAIRDEPDMRWIRLDPFPWRKLFRSH